MITWMGGDCRGYGVRPAAAGRTPNHKPFEGFCRACEVPRQGVAVGVADALSRGRGRAAVGRNLKADARWLVTFVGEKQNRFRVVVQMPGVSARARPTVPLVLNVAVHHQVTSRLDARDLRLERPRRPAKLGACRAGGERSRDVAHLVPAGTARAACPRRLTRRGFRCQRGDGGAPGADCGMYSCQARKSHTGWSLSGNG